MGMIHSKCPQCWDPIPCGCPEQKERDRPGLSRSTPEIEKVVDLLKETNKLLREQTKILNHIHLDRLR
jgi:hypothetical protein